jgi:hypothetical protein
MGMCRMPLRWLKAVLRPAEPNSPTLMTAMQYLYNHKRPNTAAHIWTGDDTACKMLSTGGMRHGKKELHAELDGRRLCLMCQNNHNKFQFISALLDSKL